MKAFLVLIALLWLTLALIAYSEIRDHLVRQDLIELCERTNCED